MVRSHERFFLFSRILIVVEATDLPAPAVIRVFLKNDRSSMLWTRNRLDGLDELCEDAWAVYSWVKLKANCPYDLFSSSASWSRVVEFGFDELFVEFQVEWVLFSLSSYSTSRLVSDRAYTFKFPFLFCVVSDRACIPSFEFCLVSTRFVYL